MNIISFDIEEWYIEKQYKGARASKYKEFDAFLDSILELLDRHRTKATFFCLGKIASEFPHVIKKIDASGHEIGCHSDKHTWLNKISRAEVLEDTRIAVDSIEQLIGRKVLSYRAPAFSIGENNKWAFEVLAECGIERDASVFPASRDFGGFPTFESKVPVLLNINDVNIKEFPIPIVKILGKEIAYSGGGISDFSH